MDNKKLKTKNIPTLRFAGFLGDWEEDKLGDIAEITTGQTPPTSGRHFYGGDFLFVSPTDFNGQRYITETKTTCTKAGFEKVRSVAKGSTLFVCIGSTIGKIAQAGEDCITNQQINAITANEDNLDNFIYFSLLRKAKKIKLLAGKQAVPIINKSEFSKIKINFPSLPEQQKIASFLGLVDEWIDNLREQKESLEKYKKGMMQKVFSQEVRFKDENGKKFGEWEEKRLGDIGKISTSSVDKKTHKEQKLISLLNYMDVYRRDHIFQSDKFQIVSARDSQIISSNLKKGDILFTPSSETPDDIGHSAVVMENLKDVLFSYHLVRFRPQKNILDHNFSAYAFKSFNFYKELWRKAQGATRFTLSKDAFESSKIQIPKNLLEQQKIANFLISLDNLIESKQQQIIQAEKWKKGLMQGLFV